MGRIPTPTDGRRDRLRRGLPIGSGLVEGVCKTVIGRRFKHGGARWHVAHVVAALRSLPCRDPSNRFRESQAG